MASPWNDMDDVTAATAETVSKRLKDMRKILECQYGLLMSLNAKNVLTDEQMAVIKESPNPFKQNDKLIDFIASLQSGATKLPLFLSSLKDTGQSHVAEYITGNVSRSDDEQPLSAAQQDLIKVNSMFLIEEIVIDNTLLSMLLSSAVLIRNHQSSIEAERTRYEKVEELLQIIKRRSIKQYNLFLNCLRETGQSHIAVVLESAEVVLRADLPMNQQVSSPIVNKFDGDKKSQAVTQFNSSLPNGAELISMKTGSVRLFFRCSSLEALTAMRDIVDSDKLKPLVESFFNSLLDGTDYAPVTMSDIHLVNYYTCQRYFLRQRATLSDNTLPMSEGHVAKLKSAKEKLQEIWEIDAVLSELVECDVLADDERKDIETGITLNDRVHEFVKLLIAKEDSLFDVFLDVLCDKDQEHIASLILAESDQLRSPQVKVDVTQMDQCLAGRIVESCAIHRGSDEPMSEAHRYILFKEKTVIANSIPSHQFATIVSSFSDCDVLDDNDVANIRSKGGLVEKILWFVVVLCNKPDYVYMRFQELLREHGLQPLASHLDETLTRDSAKHSISQIATLTRSDISTKGNDDDIEASRTFSTFAELGKGARMRTEPMTIEHSKILFNMRPYIVNRISSLHFEQIIRCLIDSEVLDGNDVSGIQRETDLKEKVSFLVCILAHKPDWAYNAFQQLLSKFGLDHLAVKEKDLELVDSFGYLSDSLHMTSEPASIELDLRGDDHDDDDDIVRVGLPGVPVTDDQRMVFIFDTTNYRQRLLGLINIVDGHVEHLLLSEHVISYEDIIELRHLVTEYERTKLLVDKLMLFSKSKINMETFVRVMCKVHSYRYFFFHEEHTPSHAFRMFLAEEITPVIFVKMLSDTKPMGKVREAEIRNAVFEHAILVRPGSYNFMRYLMQYGAFSELDFPLDFLDLPPWKHHQWIVSMFERKPQWVYYTFRRICFTSCMECRMRFSLNLPPTNEFKDGIWQTGMDFLNQYLKQKFSAITVESSKPKEYNFSKVNQDVLEQLLNWLDSQDWAIQYYDSDDAFHIAVSEQSRNEAQQMIKEKGFDSIDYLPIKIVESCPTELEFTMLGVAQRSLATAEPDKLPEADTAEKSQQLQASIPANQPCPYQLQLLPNQKIRCPANGSGCLFGGVIRSAPHSQKYGLSPGHLFDKLPRSKWSPEFFFEKIPRECWNIEVPCATSGCQSHDPGVCIGIFDTSSVEVDEDTRKVEKAVEMDEDTRKVEKDEIFEDLALLRLDDRGCQAKNLIWLNDKEYGLTLSRQSINKDTEIFFIDQDGAQKTGKIYNACYTDKSCKPPLCRTLAITCSEGLKHLQRPGDSGALVLTQLKLSNNLPASNYLSVLGVVLYKLKLRGPRPESVTIANRLSWVLNRRFGEEKMEFADDLSANGNQQVISCKPN